MCMHVCVCLCVCARAYMCVCVHTIPHKLPITKTQIRVKLLTSFVQLIVHCFSLIKLGMGSNVESVLPGSTEHCSLINYYNNQVYNVNHNLDYFKAISNCYKPLNIKRSDCMQVWFFSF